MPVDRTLAQRIVNFLNDASVIDIDAIDSLIRTRVSCKEELGNTSIQISTIGGSESDPYRVGLLGLLNGLCGSYDEGPRKGYGAIGAQYDITVIPHKLLNFTVIDNI